MFKVGFCFILLIMCWSIQAESLRDPTVPLLDQSASKSVYKPKSKNTSFQGVLLNGEHRTAMINGKVYKEGESVDGFVVKRIETNRVVLVKSGVEKVLWVYPPIKRYEN